jgi:hypothetical protein
MSAPHLDVRYVADLVRLKLTDDEISSLANYIRSAWKNRAPEVSAIDVRQQR